MYITTRSIHLPACNNIKNNDMKRLISRLLISASSILVIGCSTSMNSYEPSVYENAFFTDYVPTHISGNKFDEFTDNPFVKVADNPISTFSVDADGASYGIMRKSIDKGYTIEKSSVRIEEFLNYFTFDYPNPTDNEAVAINTEVGACPWNTSHRLLRLGIKGMDLKAEEKPRANFVFLVDVSGSMYSEDKLPLLKSGLNELLFQLAPEDRISIITYSGEVRKLLESTPVKEANKIKKAIDELQAEGSTAGGAALKMAYEEALANYSPSCNNRVIMGTDGDFNVGVTDTDSIVAMVEQYARKGIYMTCLGFGMGNLNDAMMEKVSNAGNGTYNYIDNENELMKVFVHERDRFVSVANDAKCQVTFDPSLVSSYRLIGYENRVMNMEDFNDDKKDAGEIGAGQTITALYEIVPTEKYTKSMNMEPSKSHAFATFNFRYKKTLGNNSILLKAFANVEDEQEEASANMSLASGIAAFGMLLRTSAYKGDATFSMAEDLVKKSLSFDPHGYRAEFLKLIGRAKNLTE